MSSVTAEGPVVLQPHVACCRSMLCYSPHRFGCTFSQLCHCSSFSFAVAAALGSVLVPVLSRGTVQVSLGLSASGCLHCTAQTLLFSCYKKLPFRTEHGVTQFPLEGHHTFFCQRVSKPYPSSEYITTPAMANHLGWDKLQHQIPTSSDIPLG